MPKSIIEEELELLSKTFIFSQEGRIGHRHDDTCEWGCNKHKKLREHFTQALERAYAAGQMNIIKEQAVRLEKLLERLRPTTNQ